MYKNKICKTFYIVINSVLNIVINIQNTTIFEPVILTGFYTSNIRNMNPNAYFDLPIQPVPFIFHFDKNVFILQ